jgi:hypothetical protein
MKYTAARLMTAIGHRTGLFDVMSTLSPAPSAQIAHKAGLNERYPLTVSPPLPSGSPGPTRAAADRWPELDVAVQERSSPRWTDT